MLDKYHFLQKLATLVFAFVVFVLVVLFSPGKREFLFYSGSILMLVMAYLEMLIIRDHLWVLEGSLIATKQWRDAFFSPRYLQKERWRRIFVVLFATFFFTWVYIRARETDLYSFLGIVLMVTMLYFEVLTIRDQVFEIVSSLKALEIEKKVLKESLASVGAEKPDSEDDLQPQEE